MSNVRPLKLTIGRMDVAFDIGLFILSLVIVVAGGAGALLLQSAYDPDPIKLGPDVTIFAALFVAALAIERLLEPLTMVGFSTKLEKQQVEAAEGNQVADAKDQLDTKRAGRAAFYWALATVAGFVVSALAGLYMFGAISVHDSTDTATGSTQESSQNEQPSQNEEIPNREIDLLVTGLVIGAGTKPLHDLIARIEKAKEEAEDTSK